MNSKTTMVSQPHMCLKADASHTYHPKHNPQSTISPTPINHSAPIHCHHHHQSISNY
ncbi:uncharacterized protein BDR25DRAFT_303396 [Lindgomyces ingoldianus]|uniref:Uncharacterized protein n=1 Tax=Lindgomyces ingoldianus TaxID=673940 RepID=A0ACB6QWH4_9PLEO|nr:uncharacterized protein BDR25DRAFT_303396 [Lindgomyces ingoldianus]KAF2471369.1 hypothetical protein BDR25DRAFT_303396 [Lindgomyces ingoldianus]